MLPHLNSWISIDSWKDFLRPAVQKDSCEVDNDLFKLRIYSLAIATIITSTSSLILSRIYTPSIRFFTWPILFTTSLLLFLETWRTDKAVAEKAVDEYLTKDTPSNRAHLCIKYNINLTKLLINKIEKANLNPNIILNKVDDRGSMLLSILYNFDIFKLLVSSGANVKALDPVYQKSFFYRYVRDRDPDYLEYVLKNKIVTPKDFDSSEQMEFWLNLGSAKTGEILKTYGFDVNIRDDQGYTPLLKFIEEQILPNYLAEYKRETIITLLKCGANPALTVSVEGQEKNAFQLSTNSAVKEIFEQYKAENPVEGIA